MTRIEEMNGMNTGRLQAGIGEVDITPAPGVALAGELGPRASTGVGTPLMARALLLSNGAQTLALVVLDLYALEAGTASSLVERICQETGLPREAVMILCTQTQSGPYTAWRAGGPDLNQEYLDSLPGPVLAAVTQARQSLQDASLGAGRVVLPHLVYNHRLMTRNQKAVTAWLGVPPNEVIAPEGPVDPEFCQVTLRDAHGFPICLLWNFAAALHTVDSDGLISAGLPGRVQAEVDRRLGKHVPVFALPGCSANTSYIHGLDASVDAVASAVIATYMETSGDPSISLGCALEKVVLPLRDTSQFWSRPDIELKYPAVLGVYQRELEQMQKQCETAVPAWVQVFRLGWYALAGLPGMPFVEVGLQVKADSPAVLTLVAGGAGGDIGYGVTREAFANEGYETWTARSAKIGPGGAEFLADQSAKLCKRLWKGERAGRSDQAGETNRR
jgi:neutral ceramidase